MLHELTQNMTPFEEKKIDEEFQDQTKISSSTDTESDKEELNGDVKLGSIANTLIDVTTNDSQLILKKVTQDIENLIQNSGDEVPFIGVAGAGASGKSYFCSQLKETLKKQHDIEALVVTMDGYHYYRHQLDQMEDPKNAYARRGAEFTFDAQKFVQDISRAKKQGEASFPDFDHAKKDPEENKVNFDSKKHQVVIVEGLYVLLDKQPWNELKKVFDRTYFIDTKEELIIQRHRIRMTTQMGLSLIDADKRIFGNDLVNSKFIYENTNIDNHIRLRIDV